MGDFLKDLGISFPGDPIQEDLPAEPAVETPEVVEEPVEEAPVENDPEETPEPAEPTDTPAEPVVAPVEAPADPTPAPEDPQAEIARLRALLEESNSKLLNKTSAPAAPAQQQVPTAAPQMLAFLPDGVDLEDIITDKNSLNQVMNAVYQKAVADGAQQVLLSLPQIVSAQVQQQAALKSSVDTFYTKYPHLAEFKRTVAAVATEIASEHPEWAVEQVFDAAAVKASEVIGLNKQIAGSSPSASGKPLKAPALVKPKGGRASNDGGNVNKLQKDIEELLSGV